MVKKEGKHTCNARVDVDYSSSKPKIKFSYPGKNPKKDAIKQGRVPGSSIFFVLFTFIFFIFFTLLPQTSVNLNDCNKFIKILDDDKNIEEFKLLCQEKNISIGKSTFLSGGEGYGEIYSHVEGEKILTKIRHYAALVCLSIIALYGILNLLVVRWLVKKKWYQKWLPKANAEGVFIKKKKKKYKKFKPKDVEDNILLIPYFSNVELDYKTEGDFSKQLKKIKIREYRTQKINTKTKKKSKVKIDHFKWYAIFYFKQKPKNGYLEVIYQ